MIAGSLCFVYLANAIDVVYGLCYRQSLIRTLLVALLILVGGYYIDYLFLCILFL